MQHLNTKKAQIVIETLARIIKEKREKQNKSQRLFAYEYGIQKSLLSRLENGVNEPKIISIWTVCQALNIMPSELFKLVEKELPKNFSLIEL